MLASKKIMTFMCSRTIYVGLHSLSRRCSNSENYMLSCVYYSQVRGKRKTTFDSLFKKELGESTVDETNQKRSSQTLTSHEINLYLTEFIKKPEVKNLATERGLNAKQLRLAFVRFRTYCLNPSNLTVELQILFSDILAGAAHPDDLFRPFMEYAMKMYPHLQCKDELSKICDLRDPSAWYPMARSLGRKIIYHAGPTNSGKTYNALARFMEANRSVYCGPLKMLASEVFQKTREKGFDCDLATGEERLYCSPSGEPGERVSCTVEMAPLGDTYEVAVIDEIQMLQDSQRGWAWTRALLGICAKEVHVCGEAAAIPLVQNLLATAGETIEVRNYERLTSLTIEDSAITSLVNVQAGDCIVCFNKRDLYKITKTLESAGHKVAVIYGSLPPGAKLAQCKKFNDENDPCNIMVATDAIGMGLNLNIRRIIFSSLKKIEVTTEGKKTMESISVSQALQIAGRAGRFGTQYAEGHVTTYYPNDLKTLNSMLVSLPPPAEKAGLYPTAEQIEMFAYHLPDSSLQSLLEIFTDMCQMDDSLYFMCNIESFKYLAEKIDTIQLPLRSRYIFCCSPVNIKDNLVVSMVLRMARQYSKNMVMNVNWLSQQVKWPPPVPNNLADMSKLESFHDVFDLYLWLSLRFPDLFSETDEVRKMQGVLDEIIMQGLLQLSQLMANDLEVEETETSDLYNSKKDNKRKEYSSLSHALVKSGKLSPELLDRLKYEWTQEQKQSDDKDK